MSRGDGGGLGGRYMGGAGPEGSPRQVNQGQPIPSTESQGPHILAVSFRGKGSNSREATSESSGSNSSSDWKEWMTQDAARRIQSHADKTGRNQEFKSRAQSAADKNEDK